jgi:tRNA(Arg) A34 adenosine deaminase TadA
MQNFKLSKDIVNLLEKLAIESSISRNFATGSVIFDEDQNIIESHRSAVYSFSDPTAHSELCAIQSLYRKDNSLKHEGLSLVSVFEPSLMNIAACSWANIQKVYYILPAEKFYKRIPWCTEALGIDKNAIGGSFDNKVEMIHIKEDEVKFTKIFEDHLESTKEKLVNV